MTEVPLDEGHPEIADPETRSWLSRMALNNLLGREQGVDRELSVTLKALDQTVPDQVEDFRPSDGLRYGRGREFNAKLTKSAIAAVFAEGRFTGHKDELVGATNDLLSELVVDNARDKASIGQIDHFLAHYPRNIIGGLNQKASAEDVLALITAGQSLLDLCDDYQDKATAAYLKGEITALLGSSLPQLIAAEGAGVLEDIKNVASRHGVYNLKDYVTFRLQYAGGLPQLPFTAEGITGWPAPESPFTREDADNAWERQAWMGKQRRKPEWSDLAGMAAITDQWNSEYGFTVSQAADGATTLGFTRGIEGKATNRHQLDPSSRKIFFHSHPSKATKDGLYAPLVSDGDVTSTLSNDYGGGYLNVVSKHGITVHIDSQESTDDTPKGWRVESGDLAGKMIAETQGFSESGDQIMSTLRDTEEPYLYSITASDVRNRKLLFAHIPWASLAHASVSLQDVCYGDGLIALLPLKHLQEGMPKNLYEAVQKAKS